MALRMALLNSTRACRLMRYNNAWWQEQDGRRGKDVGTWQACQHGPDVQPQPHVAQCTSSLLIRRTRCQGGLRVEGAPGPGVRSLCTQHAKPLHSPTWLAGRLSVSSRAATSLSCSPSTSRMAACPYDRDTGTRPPR